MENTEDIDSKKIEQYLSRKNDKLDNSLKNIKHIFIVFIISMMCLLLCEFTVLYIDYESSKRIDKIFHEYDSLHKEIMK